MQGDQEVRFALGVETSEVAFDSVRKPGVDSGINAPSFDQRVTAEPVVGDLWADAHARRDVSLEAHPAAEAGPARPSKGVAQAEAGGERPPALAGCGGGNCGATQQDH